MRIVVDSRDVVVGSALRRAGSILWSGDSITCDPKRPARLNDLVFGEILEVPEAGRVDTPNWIERIHPGKSSGRVTISPEPLRKGAFVGAVGNRYAPPYLIGGLQDPVTRRPNGEIRGGSIADGLFGANCVGFVNLASSEFPGARVRVEGVLIDRRRRPFNLRDFREPLELPQTNCAGDSKRVLVAGYSSDAGKTVTARALVRELTSRGLRVTFEKKSGTACCRDWLSCFPESGLESPEDGSSPAREIDIREFPARDFVDGLGVVSDVSIAIRTFARESGVYTESFVAQRSPDFHVMELADNIAHGPNWALLRDPGFASRLSAVIYCPLPRIESVLHFLSFLRSTLGLRDLPVVLSGPLANEGRFEIVRREVQARCRVPIAPSARLCTSGWESEGKDLAEALLEAMTARGRPVRSKRAWAPPRTKRPSPPAEREAGSDG
jgi:hypothetical protein